MCHGFKQYQMLCYYIYVYIKKFCIKISFKSKLLHNRFIFLIDDYLFGAHVMNVQLIT